MVATDRSAGESPLFEGHVVIASDEELRSIAAAPSAFYATNFGNYDLKHVVRLAPGSALVLRDLDAFHWLLSGEIPGEAGAANPCAFLQRGGTPIEANTRYLFDDGSDWSCSLARCFSTDESREASDAVRALDQDALRRKGGDASFVEWQKVCDLLGRQDPATRFVVAANVCLRVSISDLPLFSPTLFRRERARGQHVKGSLPEAIKAGGIPIGGADFLGFGAGPARAFPADTLATLDMTAAAPAMEKCRKRAQQQGNGLVAYERLPNQELYEGAHYWLKLGYFDVDEIADQLEEEYDDPGEAIARAVTATSGIVALERSTWPTVTDCDYLFAALDLLRKEGFLVFEYAGFEVDHGYDLVEEEVQQGTIETRPFCFFHQQCILRACDGMGLDMYFGRARRRAGGVDIETDHEVGARIVSAMTDKGLPVKWDGKMETPIVVQMIWKCRPRRGSRAYP